MSCPRNSDRIDASERFNALPDDAWGSEPKMSGHRFDFIIIDDWRTTPTAGVGNMPSTLAELLA